MKSLEKYSQGKVGDGISLLESFLAGAEAVEEYAKHPTAKDLEEIQAILKGMAKMIPHLQEEIIEAWDA